MGKEDRRQPIVRRYVGPVFALIVLILGVIGVLVTLMAPENPATVAGQGNAAPQVRQLERGSLRSRGDRPGP